MPDTVTVTSRQGWFARIAQSIAGIPVGLVFFGLAIVLLWWNEGRAVHRARSLEEGASIVVDTPVDVVNPANEGKLVHVTGLATTTETLTDTDFDISAAAIRLHRDAETYQWKETSSTKKRKTFGGGEETTTSYGYQKVWSASWIDSSRFHAPAGHQNPPGGAYWQSMTLTAERVTFGAFTLPVAVLDKMGGRQPRPMSQPDVQKMRAEGFTPGDGGYFYHCRTLSDPQIGDVRVRYEVTPPQTVSLVAVQRGSTFDTFHARAGGDILLVEEGAVSAEQMFRSERTANRIVTWALRVGGLLGMWLGLGLVLRPISVIGSFVPAIGSLLGAGIGMVSFFVALALAFTTMAIAWLAYRPLLGGSLLIAAVLSIVLVVRRRRPKAVVPPPIPTA